MEYGRVRKSYDVGQRWVALLLYASGSRINGMDQMELKGTTDLTVNVLADSSISCTILFFPREFQNNIWARAMGLSILVGHWKFAANRTAKVIPEICFRNDTCRS